MNATARLAKVVTKDEVTGMLLGGDPVAAEVRGGKRVDAAIWKRGSDLLVSVVSIDALEVQSNVSIVLPAPATKRSVILWGGEGWTLQGNCLVKSKLDPLETSLVWIEL